MRVVGLTSYEFGYASRFLYNQSQADKKKDEKNEQEFEEILEKEKEKNE